MTLKRFEAIEGRLDALESFMTSTKADFATLKGEVKTAVDNTTEILAVLTSVKKVGGVAVKHWKTALIFGVGFCSAAGIGDEKILSFLRGFIGG